MMPMREDHQTFSTALDPPATFGGRSIVDVLEAEHRELERLAADLRTDRIMPDHRRAVASVLVATLSRHISAERQDLLPAMRGAIAGGPAVSMAELSHGERLLRLLDRLGQTDPRLGGFDALADRVGEELHRHTQRAAALLPRLRRALDHDRLVRLGNRIAMDNEAAPTRPHPWAPAAPPWNRIVDPMLGAIDKVRDALIGRHVYPADLAVPVHRRDHSR